MPRWLPSFLWIPAFPLAPPLAEYILSITDDKLQALANLGVVCMGAGMVEVSFIGIDGGGSGVSILGIVLIYLACRWRIKE